MDNATPPFVTRPRLIIVVVLWLVRSQSTNLRRQQTIGYIELSTVEMRATSALQKPTTHTNFGIRSTELLGQCSCELGAPNLKESCRRKQATNQ
jgi:hypothetical protein